MPDLIRGHSGRRGHMVAIVNLCGHAYMLMWIEGSVKM